MPRSGVRRFEPRLAVIRPYSSKAVEFISSCIPLGWNGIVNCVPVRAC